MPETTAIEFLNTRRGGKRGAADAVDSLRSFDDLVDWIARAGLLARPYASDSSEPAAVTKAAFDLSLKLRSNLETFLAMRDAGARRSLAKTVNEALHEPLAVMKVAVSADAFVAALHYRERTAANVPFALATEILSFLESAPLAAVKRCAADDCIWFFIDETKNGSRRWCASELCGARHRARKHYRKSQLVKNA